MLRAGKGFGLPVLDRAGALRRKILVQRAAERRVDELAAAADAEDGQTRPHRFLQQRKLQRVPFRAELHALVEPRFSVHGGVDVRPAGEENAAAEGEEPVEILAFAREGEDQGQPARHRYAPEIAGVHIGVAAALLERRRQCDQRFHEPITLSVGMPFR